MGRIVTAAAVALLAAAGMANLHLTPGSAMGLATDAPIAYGVVIAVCALVAAIRPSIGVLFGYGAFVVGLAGAGAWVPAVLLTAATARGGISWAAAHRPGGLGAHAAAARLRGFRGGLAGDVRRAAAGAAIGHTRPSPRECPHHGRLRLGRHLNWDAVMHLGFRATRGGAPGGGVAAGHLGRGASWIAAAGLWPLVRARHRAFDIAGSVVAAVVLMFGACAAAHLASFGGSWLLGGTARALVPTFSASRS
ncbi:MAG: hypothetical protein ACLUE1_07690 [Adlercreutzia equolifaciens]